MHQTAPVKNTAESVLVDVVGRSVPQIASAIGVDKTTIYRQLNGKGLTADMAIRISRQFEVEILDLLTALGIITEAERGRMKAGASLSDATDRQLLEELLRRVDQSEAHDELIRPISDETLHGALGRSPVEVTVRPIDEVDEINTADAIVIGIGGSVVNVGGADEDDLLQLQHAANRDDSAGDEEPETP